MKQKIAFLGLGNMGGPMAANLVKAGFDVTAFDLVPAALEKAVEAGCSAANKPVDATQGADFVITMLPSGAIVEGLYIDRDALLDAMPATALVIDCSTIAPHNAQRIAAEAENRGIGFIDAPVSGGVAGAAAGTLSFMCGGSEQNVQRAQVVLQAMGKNIFRAGDAGAGQVAKICNNMLLAVQMVGVSEALQLGLNNGLDPEILTDILSNSTSNCWSLRVQNPVPGVVAEAPAGDNYQGGFMTKLMQKDLGLALETAQQSQSYTPMGSLAANIFGLHSLADKGNAELDFSSVIKLFESSLKAKD